MFITFYQVPYLRRKWAKQYTTMYDCYVSMKVRDTIFKEWEIHAHQWAMDNRPDNLGLRFLYNCISLVLQSNQNKKAIHRTICSTTEYQNGFI